MFVPSMCELELFVPIKIYFIKLKKRIMINKQAAPDVSPQRFALLLN